MLIYLRHGDDRGNDEYRHDRHLNDRGRKQAGKAFGELVDKHGHPDIVFVSPFWRVIETLDVMNEHFTRTVEVHRDARIAQYLGAKHDPQVSPETAAHVTAGEDKAGFRTRVREHVEDVKRRNENRVAIWCITHQSVIEEVAGYFDVKIRDDLDFLDHVIMLR